MANFGDKLKELRQNAKLTQTELAQRAGLSLSFVQKAEAMKAPLMRGTNLRKLAEALGLNVHELDRAWRTGKVPRQRTPGIPIYGKAPAGVGGYVGGYDQGVSEYDDEYLPKSLCPDDDDAFATWVTGDSMIPEFRPGDLVVYSPRRAIEGQIVDGDVVHVRIDDETNCIKRVFSRGEELELVSDNRAYRPLIVKKEDVKRMAKVVKKIVTYQ